MPEPPELQPGLDYLRMGSPASALLIEIAPPAPPLAPRRPRRSLRARPSAAAEEPAAAREPAPAAGAGDAGGAEAAAAGLAAVTTEPPAGTRKPPVTEGGTIDQAEMRRRIEETRAKLKAKAFDAMMAGEAALLSRDSGERPVPKGEDVKLDAELDATIDEGLSRDDD